MKNQVSTQRGEETMSAQNERGLPHIQVTNSNIGRNWKRRVEVGALKRDQVKGLRLSLIHI